MLTFALAGVTPQSVTNQYKTSGPLKYSVNQGIVRLYLNVQAEPVFSILYPTRVIFI